MNYETEKNNCNITYYGNGIYTCANCSTNQSKAATATITLSGSTSISPLAQQLAKQYAKENKGIKINFTNITGSGSGISEKILYSTDYS